MNYLNKIIPEEKNQIEKRNILGPLKPLQQQQPFLYRHTFAKLLLPPIATITL